MQPGPHLNVLHSGQVHETVQQLKRHRFVVRRSQDIQQLRQAFVLPQSLLAAGLKAQTHQELRRDAGSGAAVRNHVPEQHILQQKRLGPGDLKHIDTHSNIRNEPNTFGQPREQDRTHGIPTKW